MLYFLSIQLFDYSYFINNSLFLKLCILYHSKVTIITAIKHYKHMPVKKLMWNI